MRTAAHAHAEPIAIPMRRGIAPIADLIALFRLWRLIGIRKPDVVEFSTPKAGLLGTVAASLRRVPRRVYQLRGLRCETAIGFKRKLLLAAERLASACAHVVLCNSQSLRAKALALRVAPEDKLLVLGEGSTSGVDITRYSPGPSTIREKLGIPRIAPVIGFVGRLTRDKGIPELIRAFDSILSVQPCARLLLVGWFDAADDALSHDLRDRIERHHAIDCTGFVSDTVPYYRAMDLLVLPTWREGFPNVVLEAAATGLPVITTQCTGACDSIVPEITGLLIPPGYPEAISKAVMELLDDPERRLCMGRAARAWAIEHYLQSQVLGLASSFYHALVEEAPPARNVRSSLVLQPADSHFFNHTLSNLHS
jgi:glycosyltransferase involved in cell wall biosynthesis